MIRNTKFEFYLIICNVLFSLKSLAMEILFFLRNKSGILPSYNYISFTEWLYHLSSNKTLQEKWEVHKDARCYFKQILEAVTYSTVFLSNLSCSFMFFFKYGY